MKRMILICLLVIAVVLSLSVVSAEDGFYVIATMKKNYAPVPKTGQTTSYATGDDGDLEKGISLPNPRFTINGDGTVTDSLTGLMWLKDANCIQSNYPGFDTDETVGDGKVTWQHALDFVAGINAGTYTDCGSIYTDWYLPDARELHSLIHFGYHSPALSNTNGTGKWNADDPFTGLQSQYYWSSTTASNWTSNAWMVHFNNGTVQNSDKGSPHYVWPVRDGN